VRLLRPSRSRIAFMSKVSDPVFWFQMLVRPERSGPSWIAYVVARFWDSVGDNLSPAIVSLGWQRRYKGVDEIIVTVTVLSMHGYGLDWHTVICRSGLFAAISPVMLPRRNCSCTRGGADIVAPSNAFAESFLVRNTSNSQFLSFSISWSTKMTSSLCVLFQDATLASELPHLLTTTTFSVDGVRIPYRWDILMNFKQLIGRGALGVNETVILASVHKPPPWWEILLAAEKTTFLTRRGDLG